MKILQKGQAAILIVFVLGMIAVLIGLSQVKLGTLESFRGRGSANSLQAYYSANSGIEDAIKRIGDGEGDGTTLLSVGGEINNVKVTIITNPDETRTVRSVAKNGNFIRSIKTNLTKYAGTDFSNAIYAGAGGLYLDKSTVVTNIDITKDADVYSESFIRGNNRGSSVEIDKKTGSLICTPNSASAVYGNAKVEQIISGFVGDMNPNRGVCITKDAYSQVLDTCLIGGKGVYGLTGSYNSSSCTAGGGFSQDPVLDDPPFEEEQFPVIDVSSIESKLSGIYSGDCEISSKSKTDCSFGTGELGNIVIDGNLKIDGDLKITGSIWVKKNITFVSNKVNVSMPDDNTIRYLIADGNEGKIVINPGVNFAQYDKTFLVLVSTYDEGSNLYCNDGDASNDAINISANVKSVLFYAKNGCVSVSGPSASSEIKGAIYGKEVYLKNASLLYDSDLSAVSGGGSHSGWQILSFEEY